MLQAPMSAPDIRKSGIPQVLGNDWNLKLDDLQIDPIDGSRTLPFTYDASFKKHCASSCE
jgi:hypothetical protein